MSFQDEVNEAKEAKENKEDPKLEADEEQEGNEEEQVEEEQTDDQDDSEQGDASEGEQEEELDDKEKERLRKQEEYRERKRKEAEEKKQAQYQAQMQQATEQTTSAGQSVQDDELDELRQLARAQKFERAVTQAERELAELEKPFKEAFDDYDDMVDKALNFTTRAYVKKGMSEQEAKEAVRKEKVLLADRAAAQGQDPVEAVYKEAQSIVSVIDEMAVELGYTKGKARTNLQAAKELSKPNAMSGGSGTRAARRDWTELDDDDMDTLSGLTLGDVGLK